MNKGSVLFTIAILLAGLSSSFAQENTAVLLNIDVSKTKTKNRLSDIPAWLERTNLNVQGGRDQKTSYFVETVQPLGGMENDAAVFFSQLRLTTQSERPSYNFGLGLRKILDDKYLLGLNSFYDYQERHSHSRAGIGVEMITNWGLETRANSYLLVSHERLVGKDLNYEYFEKVANGFDWEIGRALPHLPLIKVYGGGTWYDFIHQQNKYGWKLRAEYTPAPYSRISFKIFDDTTRDKLGYEVEGAVSLSLTSFAWRDIAKDFTSDEANPKTDLSSKVLDRVVRDNRITVIPSTR